MLNFAHLRRVKTAQPTGGHTNILTNFELSRDFIGANLLTKFHEDGTRNVASRVRTDVRRKKTGQKSSPEQSDPEWPMFKLIQLLTKFGVYSVRQYLCSAFHGIFVRRPGAARGGSGGIQLLTKFGKGHIQLLTKFGEDRMKTT
ncbi:hypothetical protein DPMN_011246 [Dreissena polymorpha]|uniref:Uncharacterized protein n=1 Tax=Dreissena polymorpha TaxID=45954 RepID=A0A9D4N3P5_DREPO|nr:hypothetical protein DPMN_011246 [Dreissena polymorpha]